MQYSLLVPLGVPVFGSFVLAAAVLVIGGVIFHLFGWGFRLDDSSAKVYAVMFAILVLISAIIAGFTGEALLTAVAKWCGYMVGLLLLRWRKIGRFDDAM